MLNKILVMVIYASKIPKTRKNKKIPPTIGLHRDYNLLLVCMSFLLFYVGPYCPLIFCVYTILWFVNCLFVMIVAFYPANFHHVEYGGVELTMHCAIFHWIAYCELKIIMDMNVLKFSRKMFSFVSWIIIMKWFWKFKISKHVNSELTMSWIFKLEFVIGVHGW